MLENIICNILAVLISDFIIKNYPFHVRIHKVTIPKKMNRILWCIVFTIKCQVHPKKYLSEEGMKSRWKFCELFPSYMI